MAGETIVGVGPVASNQINERTVLQEDLVSAGGDLTITAGTSIIDALKAVMDLVDPSGG